MSTNDPDKFIISRFFSQLINNYNAPSDEFNFLLSQIMALILAGIFRVFLKPGVVSSTARHSYLMFFGVVLGYFCFGKQLIHLAILPTLCYVVIQTQSPHIVQKMVFILAMGYLSCIHCYRQIYEYGSYNLDITGPLMVITQKVTSLAFSIHDGLTKEEKDLTPLQRHQAVKIMPTAIEYFGYMFHFQTLMAGPLVFYRDYIDFIQGTRLKGTKSFIGFYDDVPSQEEIILEPSPMRVVIKKVVISYMCIAVFTSFLPEYSIQRIKDNEFVENTSFLFKFWFIIVGTMVVRFKYYYAWIFSEAVCNNSGLGYNGKDENGNDRWDITSNIDIIGFELSLSLKDSIDCWNKCTNRWLRMVAYERSGHYRVALTYTLSAVWHGFYPGYYLTFFCGALFTFASRTVRRYVRPHFLISESRKFYYDILTFITSRICMAYLTFTFILLEFLPAYKMYMQMYLTLHWLSLLVIFIVPLTFPEIKPNGNPSDKIRQLNSSANNSAISNGRTKKTE